MLDEGVVSKCGKSASDCDILYDLHSCVMYDCMIVRNVFSLRLYVMYVMYDCMIVNIVYIV